MKNGILFFVSILAAVASASSTLSVTDFARNPTTGVYKVTYTLSGDPAVVTFGVKLNGTELPDAATRRVGGAVNRLQQPGTGLTLTWCPHEAESVLAQAPDASLLPVLKAWPTNSPPDYMAIDLYSCSGSGMTCPNFAYYTSTNAFPYPVTDRRYKTDYLVMRRIPAKDVVWRMGSPTTELGRTANVETTHYVKLTNDYYMAIYETTHRQWAYMRGEYWTGYVTYGISTNIPYGEYDTYPIGANVGIKYVRGRVWPTNTYDLTAGYISTIRTRTGLRLDLPTEAQWEFACRAGTTNALYNGKEISQSNAAAPELDDIAWYRYNSSVQTVWAGVTQMPHPVGLKQPNSWGLYDMLGNMSEICLDWYEPITLAGRPDPATTLYVEPVGPDTWYYESDNGGYQYRRVVRGGGYASSPYHCRAAHRHGWNDAWGDGGCYETVS